MKKYLVIIITALILLPCIAISQENPAASSAPGVVVQIQGETDAQPTSEADTQQNTLEILKSIVKSKATLKQRLDEKKQALAKPGIMELKRLTVKARHKSKLNDELAKYQELLPLAIKARTRIESLIRQAKTPAL